jgi:hypothetical protein
MALSRALAFLLIFFLVAAIAPASMADDDDVEFVRYNKEPKRQPPCTECYKNCIQTWKEHTCEFKCFLCLPLNETISGSPPSSGK